MRRKFGGTVMVREKGREKGRLRGMEGREGESVSKKSVMTIRMSARNR